LLSREKIDGMQSPDLDAIITTTTAWTDDERSIGRMTITVVASIVPINKNEESDDGIMTNLSSSLVAHAGTAGTTIDGSNKYQLDINMA
jgi:hypothetical protein